MEAIIASIVVLILLIIINFIMCIVNSSKLKELNEYAEDGDLAETLKIYYKKVSDLRRIIHDSSDKSLENRISLCERNIRNAYTKMCVTHFDAFDGITGKQSFSLALLDSSNSGIILTSIYGHSSCNTYIRNVTEGTASVKLIDEEIKALNGAMNNMREVN